MSDADKTPSPGTVTFKPTAKPPVTKTPDLADGSKPKETVPTTPVKDKHAPLTIEQLSKMNRHEIRAVAHDRGLQVGEGSHSVLVERFLQEQAK